MIGHITRDESGAEALNFQFLSIEEKSELIEALKILRADNNYKIYRRLLISAKEAYMNSCMNMTDPNMVMKTMGIASGINFDLNQIDAILAGNAMKEKRKKEVPAE